MNFRLRIHVPSQLTASWVHYPPQPITSSQWPERLQAKEGVYSDVLLPKALAGVVKGFLLWED
jgi:hypothetical protein